MERLTKKDKIKTWYKSGNAVWVDLSLYEKLQALENIEEELGVDLITLFKAMKDGVWVWNDKEHTEHFLDEIVCITKHKAINEYETLKTDSFKLIGTDTYETKDYGKTWSLNKNDLQNDAHKPTQKEIEDFWKER